MWIYMDEIKHSVDLWSLLRYLISVPNPFQILFSNFLSISATEWQQEMERMTQKIPNRILSIFQIASLAQRNLNWKSIIYILNRKDVNPEFQPQFFFLTAKVIGFFSGVILWYVFSLTKTWFWCDTDDNLIIFCHLAWSTLQMLSSDIMLL